MFKNKTILVTGGTGSWGHELVSQLLEKYDVKEIRIYSRGEHKQVDMKREFKNNPKLKFIIGDVRDKNVLSFAMRGVDYVFHLAALKHVPICEDNGWEAVLTNIYGTQNLIECSIERGVKKVVDASTDKAVEPFNLYGVTKACGEKLMINANKLSDCQTKFIAIRGGNVIGTAGSVIPLFREQLAKNNEITVTNENMTRFLMSTREAINLVFKAVEESIGGEIFVMRMPAIKLKTLIRVMVKMFGNKKTKVKKIGVRPGEKINEVLISKNEIERAKEFSRDYFVILPEFGIKGLEEKYKKFKKVKLPEFNSRNTVILDEEKLEKLLRKEKWLLEWHEKGG